MKLEDIGFYTLEDNRAKNATHTSRLWRCELLLTNKCNFNCLYCRGTSDDANITFDYAVKIIDIWSRYDVKNIRFSGGEPTVVPWLPDIVEYAEKKGIERIAISTNGSANYAYYSMLYKLGVTDFSISFDSCCSETTKIMTGGIDVFNKLINNIKKLSELTYVTVGMVFTEKNVKEMVESIEYACNLGVSDIRIISSAQYNKLLVQAEKIPNKILNKYPILRYRINNIKKNRNVRGITDKDTCLCPLMLDDMAIKGQHHYPCIIKLREGCNPIGKINDNIRTERLKYFQKLDTHKDNICKNNCLDVCVDYNNKWAKHHNL